MSRNISATSYRDSEFFNGFREATKERLEIALAEEVVLPFGAVTFAPMETKIASGARLTTPLYEAVPATTALKGGDMTPTKPSRRALLAGAGAALAAAGAPSPALAAPGFPGIDAWLNSGPLSPGSLRGRVYVVSFWTRQCFNCRHALPYIKGWYAKHAARGFTVVGVHTPEFEVERSLPALRAAVASLGIRHPVAQDNESTTWNAWGNQYWPAEYLVDRQGRIVHRQVGEGGYTEMDGLINSFLG